MIQECAFWFAFGSLVGCIICACMVRGWKRIFPPQFPAPADRTESLNLASWTPVVTDSRVDVTDTSEWGDIRRKAPDFSVTGTPRRVPWHIRKRELEEAARTKRKRLESFQEYV